jgi:hypothetical protein
MMTFWELLDSDHRCRFPLDGDDHWCGAETIGRSSWCAEHRARVFLPEERIPRYLRLDDKRPQTKTDEIRDTWRRMGNAA